MKETVAIIGAGSIGSAFALLFGLAGHRVQVHDSSTAALDALPASVARAVAAMCEFGLLERADAELAQRIVACSQLGDAVAGAAYVQECAPENLALKRELFAALDRLAAPQAVLASSTSALPASSFAAGLPGASRCLVAHPGNPPHLLRVVELVPAPFTAPASVERAAQILVDAGLHAVRVRREIEGFVFNRLQGALLREAYCLVRDGVIDVEDVDRLVRDGLGLRWSVVGPFETVDLNTRGGIEAHAARLGPAYARMGAERGQHDPWTPELVAEVTAQRRARLPLSEWSDRVQWRDRRLMAALAARREDRGPGRRS